MINSEVLIVGAGPTGLTLAVDLTRRGINRRIIDKNLHRCVHSRALFYLLSTSVITILTKPKTN